MHLIVDSGSTKTDWSFCDGNKIIRSLKTQGINPCHQAQKTISAIISDEMISALPDITPSDVDHIYFYGAGCATPSICNDMKNLLQSYFITADIAVESDMLGAARALCGRSEGIACVLGTGSNSCLYNGSEISDQVPSLGYILGDEGSSTALGKRLISDCLKRQLPEEVASEFMERYDLSTDSIIENVYRKPMGNRYMSEFTVFLEEKRHIKEVHNMLVSCFQEFFRKNVMNYHRPWLPVNFTGSMATVFSQELSEAAESLGMSIGKIMKAPTEGLVEFHA